MNASMPGEPRQPPAIDDLARAAAADYHAVMDKRLSVLEMRFDTVLPTLATKADIAELRMEQERLRGDIAIAHERLGSNMAAAHEHLASGTALGLERLRTDFNTAQEKLSTDFTTAQAEIRGATTRLDVVARQRCGRNDWGVNATRLRGWLSQL